MSYPTGYPSTGNAASGYSPSTGYPPSSGYPPSGYPPAGSAYTTAGHAQGYYPPQDQHHGNHSPLGNVAALGGQILHPTGDKHHGKNKMKHKKFKGNGSGGYQPMPYGQQPGHYHQGTSRLPMSNVGYQPSDHESHSSGLKSKLAHKLGEKLMGCKEHF